MIIVLLFYKLPTNKENIYGIIYNNFFWEWSDIFEGYYCSSKK